MFTYGPKYSYKALLQNPEETNFPCRSYFKCRPSQLNLVSARLFHEPSSLRECCVKKDQEFHTQLAISIFSYESTSLRYLITLCIRFSSCVTLQSCIALFLLVRKTVGINAIWGVQSDGLIFS